MDAHERRKTAAHRRDFLGITTASSTYSAPEEALIQEFTTSGRTDARLGNIR
jgi:hypothetical protein